MLRSKVRLHFGRKWKDPGVILVDLSVSVISEPR